MTQVRLPDGRIGNTSWEETTLENLKHDESAHDLTLAVRVIETKKIGEFIELTKKVVYITLGNVEIVPLRKQQCQKN